MVRRQGTEFGCQGGSLTVGQLVGVQADGESRLMCGGEHLADLVVREGDGLTEGVDRISQSFLNDSRNEFLAYLSDVAIQVVAVLRWHRMSGQQRCDNPLGSHRSKLSRRSQHAELVASGSSRSPI